MDAINLNTFLKLGFFLRYHNPSYSINISNVNKKLYKDASEAELIDKGVELLKAAISENFSAHETHVVPISGGLDSRFILACLLEHTSAENIYTYTFGSPKTWDYEIGNLLAKKIGTHHMSFSLTQHQYHMDELIDTSRRMDHQTVLFHHPPVYEIDRLFAKHWIWSGWLGGEITGSHLPKEPASTLEGAKQSFVRKNTFVTSIDIRNCSDKEFFGLIERDALNREYLCFEEQFDFKNRQLKYIAPHVLFKGVNYKTPFLHQELVGFMLSIPAKYRHKKYLYNKMLLKSFPGLFTLPTKENLGLSLASSSFSVFGRRVLSRIKKEINKIKPVFTDPGINYLDFNQALRERSDLKKIVYDNLIDLKQRNIIDWIDFDKIWNTHMNKKANHADALMVLASLEIHLKAGKKLT